MIKKDLYQYHQRNSRISPSLFKVNSVFARMNASATSVYSYSITPISGYTPVAVAGVAASGTYDGGYQKIYHIVVDGYLLRIGWSITNAAGYGCTVYILHIHN